MTAFAVIVAAFVIGWTVYEYKSKHGTIRKLENKK